MARQIMASGKRHIVLLGGEPTLYGSLSALTAALVNVGFNVYITTNGSTLGDVHTQNVLCGVAGVNVSIHDNNLSRHNSMTGIRLDADALRDVISILRASGCRVRLNCTCVRGHVDSRHAAIGYVGWARRIGASSVRFAELKGNDSDFVDLIDLFGRAYGLNHDPYSEGCNAEAVIDDMPVLFRQMCGFHTSRRPIPPQTSQIVKRVLYYDGRFYDGWQVIRRSDMDKKKLLALLKSIAEGKTKPDKAVAIIQKMERPASTGGGFCQY